MKSRIVISGVNLVDVGPLSIYRDALRSLIGTVGDRYEIIALVHRKHLLDIDGVRYLEFPEVKGSWLKRISFEYLHSFHLSKELRPALWIAMHDMTPRVCVERQYVYCHNPSPFYRFNLSEARMDPTFGLFTLFYRFLYGFFLKRNEGVIVQQDWIRNEFIKRYGVLCGIVARPSVHVTPVGASFPVQEQQKTYRFFYPAFPRTFKNHELLLKAASLLEARGITGFELILTVNANHNRYGKQLFERYGALKCVRWIGSISRDEVYRLYREVDCLVFPSKLETWGLPLTEFQTTGKPILVVDLPYAHETIGSYDQTFFFDAEDSQGLANAMAAAITGSLAWQRVEAKPISAPYAADWNALWKMILEPSHISRPRTSCFLD